ncbi:spermidine/putrescine transport system substrate-binding protein [Burkholderia sp. D7]|nr:spermidine/putrescine transport system substrate-binding protein [Burkholderia sp. D7]
MDIQRRFESLNDQHLNGDLSRRRFLCTIGVMAAACGVAGLGFCGLASAARSDRAIRFDGFGGFSQSAFDKFVLQPFARQFSVSVTQGSYTNPDQFLAQIQAEGVHNYNVFWAAQELSPVKVVRLGLAEPLDEAKIPRLRDLQTSAVEANRKQGSGRLISVPYSMSGGAIAYNTQAISAEEIEKRGFGILVDRKLNGSISGFDNWQYRIYYAALQAGQDPNNIQDMGAVWEKISESKSVALKYYSSGAEQTGLLASHEAIVADAWFVSIHNLQKRGEPIGYWPLEGSYTQYGSLVALKGTPMDLFYEMVDVLLRPEVLFPLASATGNLPLLDPHKHPFPKDIADIPGYLPPESTLQYRRFDPVYWDKNSNAWSRAYERVLSSS